MRGLEDRRTWIGVVLVLLLVSLVAALFTVGPFGFVFDVSFDSPLPVSVERMAMGMKGLGRSTSEYRKIRKDIGNSVYFDSVSFDCVDGILHVEAVPDDGLFLFTDGMSYVLYVDGDVSIPGDEDLAYIRMNSPLLEVTGGQLEYIARYGIEKRLSEVIDLLLEIYHSSSYNDRLVGKVKYQGGTGEEFGRLTFFTFGMDSSLLVRDKVDPDMVLKSLSVMKGKSRVLPTGEMREYELKGNMLTEQKRIVDGI